MAAGSGCKTTLAKWPGHIRDDEDWRAAAQPTPVMAGAMRKHRGFAGHPRQASARLILEMWHEHASSRYRMFGNLSWVAACRAFRAIACRDAAMTVAGVAGGGAIRREGVLRHYFLLAFGCTVRREQLFTLAGLATTMQLSSNFRIVASSTSPSRYMPLTLSCMAAAIGLRYVRFFGMCNHYQNSQNCHPGRRRAS